MIFSFQTRGTQKKIFFFLIIFLFSLCLVNPNTLFAQNSIGTNCNGDLEGNSSCASGDCEDSSKQIDEDDFCDCDDDNDCRAEYGQAHPNVTSWECWDGAHATYDLDYCVGTIPGGTSIVKYPIPPRDPGFVDSLLDPQITLDEIQKNIKEPQTKITIPGLEFSEAQAVIDRGKTYMIFPFLGEYIAAFYRYAVVIASALAVLVLIFSGIQWMIPGGFGGEGDSTQNINQAKKRITGALLGLTIAVGSYTILYLVNPEMVKFENLRVLTIDTIEYEAIYPEGAPEDPASRGYVGGNPKPSGSAKCIYDNYTPGKKIGEKPDIERFNLFGIKSIPFNKNAIHALKKVHSEVLASNNDEVKGYIQYMKDFKAGKVPDLMGEKDGAGVISQSLGKGIGLSRKSGKPLGKLTYDMHVMGLAVDIMTRSNWDLNWGGSSKGHPAKQYCEIYKRTLEKMKNGFYGQNLTNDPYKMYARLEKNITDCLNKFNNGKNPFTSLPQEMITIFERNNFYWGGYGWGNKMRSDSMHFEYRGNCS